MKTSNQMLKLYSKLSRIRCLKAVFQGSLLGHPSKVGQCEYAHIKTTQCERLSKPVMEIHQQPSPHWERNAGYLHQLELH
ncbi:hypothetical protein GDO86_000327 [Hymenochirus boettgeri]|uniref:Uncharacterized protein n=1 Tax=Hymenochirus boettgeri TaxID=247094 RepID=A0A8T2KAJ8_9PIPI|nr:hypothetical protein GDO86_000327 [Hymenochirus boettgeri]